MDIIWMIVKLTLAGLATSAAQSSDFFTEFEANNQSYWLNVAKQSIQVSSNLCKNKQRVLALFDTNEEHSAVAKSLTDVFKSQNISQADVWVNFTVTHDLLSNRYTHSWGRQVFDSVWSAGKPDANCVKYPDFCCARMSWENHIYVGLKDSGCFTVYNFLCGQEHHCLRSNCSHGCKENLTHYTCICPEGYTLAADGRSCEEVGLCIRSPCTATCAASNGSVACGCSHGYELQSDGYTCRDIDECRNNSSLCDQDCVNTEGSFSCSCRSGYFIDITNKICVDVNECKAFFYLSCSQNCSNTPGSYRCECYRGFRLGADNVTCLDMDECVSRPCQYQCSNTAGSYHCACPTGHTLSTNGITCVDVDECMSSPCQYQCNNTAGSYHCTCPTGHTLSTNGTACLDVDECQDTKKCQGACTNTVGSYFCGCHHGYQDINKLCVDVDECVDGQHNCSQKCHNFDGGYNCSCHQGYTTPDDNSYECHDIDECHDDNQTCQHNCVNTNGSHHCTCDKGYNLGSDNRSCHDIDECQLNTTLCGHFCNNTQGSFYCLCPPGLSIDQDGRSCVMIHRKCPCLCSHQTRDDALCRRRVAVMEDFKKDLIVNVRNVSAYVRSKTSANDKRATARSLGYTGLAFVVSVAFLLVALDVTSIFRFVNTTSRETGGQDDIVTGHL